MPTTAKGEQPTTHSPTPETDAVEARTPKDSPVCPWWYEMRDHARLMERQRDEARRNWAAVDATLTEAEAKIADLTRQLTEAKRENAQTGRMFRQSEFDKESLRRQSAALQERVQQLEGALKEIRELVGLHMLVHGGACADFAPTVHSKTDTALRSTATT